MNFAVKSVYFKHFARLALFLLAGTLVDTVMGTLVDTNISIAEKATAQSTPPSSATALWEKRGQKTEKKYLAYTEQLNHFYSTTKAIINRQFPDLLQELQRTPPKPVAYGYQTLPKIIKDEPKNTSAPPAKVSSVTYSWPRTDQFIDNELKKLDGLKDQLRAIDKVSTASQRPIVRTLIHDLKTLTENQLLIDNHVQYNQFWQRAIAEDRPRFDRLTELHDLVEERERLRENLRTQSTPDPSTVRRERDIADRIHQHAGEFTRAPFLKVIQASPNLTLVEVPLYTDIEDLSFLRRFRQAVESRWKVRNNAHQFQLRLRIKQKSSTQLYPSRQLPAPRRGAHLDPNAHLKHFPIFGGVLTTGVNSTYALPARAILLGPQDISENVLAHEFGHILGFIDGYLRGYRDRGEDGFEVLEIVPDPRDIMHTPGLGIVEAHHFDRILKLQTNPISD